MTTDGQKASSSEPVVPVLRDAGRSDGSAGTCLVWRLEPSLRSVSSALIGGGIGIVSWVLNATVADDYGRFDPDLHLMEMASRLDLAGPGIAMMTAVDVAEFRTATVEGATVWATVGVGNAVWAAGRETSGSEMSVTPVRPGTINLVAQVPVMLSDAALINAVATATEAKTQALLERGVDGTGTASDALCVLCARDGPAEPFGGPRSTWGSRLAEAAYLAVIAGIDGQDPKKRWSALQL